MVFQQTEQIAYLFASQRKGVLVCKCVTALGFPAVSFASQLGNLCKTTFAHTAFAPVRYLGLQLKPGTLKSKQLAISDTAFLLRYSEFDDWPESWEFLVLVYVVGFFFFFLLLCLLSGLQWKYVTKDQEYSKTTRVVVPSFFCCMYFYVLFFLCWVMSSGSE